MCIKAKTSSILGLALSLFLFTTCNNSSKKNTNDQKNNADKPAASAEWTVMVFMNGDNNLEPDAIQDFQEMALIGSDNKVNIVAQMDLIGKYSNIGWTKTLRFRITKGMDPKEENAVMDIGEANMGDQRVMGDFVSWAVEKYPAKKYILIIWDHGQGYRLLEANNQLTKDLGTYVEKLQDSAKSNTTSSTRTAKESTSNANIHVTIGDPFRSGLQSPFKSCSNDETNKDELYNREIQDGLTSALKGEKIDVLGFDACLMAMVETGYAVRNVCNNFVGSEELEPGTGWKYDDWLGKLLSNPTMDGQELSKSLVESYKTTYGTFSRNTLSAIDITAFGTVAETISIFANSLKNKLNNELPAIKAARKECAVYAPNPYNEEIPKDYFFHIDFIRFCDQLIAQTKDDQLKKDADNAKKAILKTILNNYKGDLRGGKFGSNGLAIYFPISNTQYKDDRFENDGYKKDNTFFPVEFVQKQKWADFLHAYFQKVP